MATPPSFPGFRNLYHLHQSGSDREFRADIDLRGADPLKVTRGEQKVPTRAVAEWTMGYSVPGHVVWTTNRAPFLVSVDLVAALRAAAISGWRTYAVTLKGKSGGRLAGYSGFIIRGRCGQIDFSRGVRTKKKFPGGMFPILRGVGFEEKSWDGSDIFMPAGGEDGEGSGFVFVTERAKKVIARIAKKVQFTPVDEIEVPF